MLQNARLKFMILISEALTIIERETRSLKSETIDLDYSVGRILAKNIKADMNLPPFDRSQMDGFAVKSKDTRKAPVKLKVIGESVAGKGFGGKVKAGEAVRIMTGAPVPAGADAVQKVELTVENDEFVEIIELAKPQQNINLYASEVAEGAKIFGKGERIIEQMIAALASFGYAQVKAFRKPRVSILSTGSEIVDVAETPGKDQIRNSNSTMLKVFVRQAGGQAEILPRVGDDLKTIESTIKEAAKNCDVLIVSGGVSVGDYDFTKPALRSLGAEIFFEKISLKPGKPTVFAKLNDTLIFGLPGNPVSSAVTFYLFVRPAILQMQRAKDRKLKTGFARVANRLKAAKERDSVLPASIEADEKGQLIIESLRFNGSSNFIAFARANALVFVPQGKDLETGEIAEIMFLP